MPRSKRVIFRLHCQAPSSVRHPSAPRDYNLVETVPHARAEELGIKCGSPTYFRHTWSDGWSATVSATVMRKGERRPKSAGFSGYEWMVRNIIRWGHTECRCEWGPTTRDYGEGEWEACKHCSAARKVKAAVSA